MNSHQRRKLNRKRLRELCSSDHLLIKDWAELAKVPDSKTHFLEIDVDGCNGWIKSKENKEELGHYLSTHTFYGSNYQRSTYVLRRFGFNVPIDNWDK